MKELSDEVFEHFFPLTDSWGIVSQEAVIRTDSEKQVAFLPQFLSPSLVTESFASLLGFWDYKFKGDRGMGNSLPSLQQLP